MVDQSELAFRALCRKYGAEAAYTPMLHSRLFAGKDSYRKEMFTTCPEDRPLFVQFCTNDPADFVQAASFVQDQVMHRPQGCGVDKGSGLHGSTARLVWKKTVQDKMQRLRVPARLSCRCPCSAIMSTSTWAAPNASPRGATTGRS